MTDDRTQDQGLDVPKSELITQDEVGEGAGGDNSLLTALGGGASNDEFMEDEPSTSSGSKFTPRTAIIAAIVVGGGGMIYGMRQYEINQGMKMGVFAEGSANVAALTSQLTEKEKQVLYQLRESAKPTVEAPDLGRNPVELEGVEEPVEIEGPVDTGPDIEELTREYTRLAEMIVVSSIVPKGKVPVAVINKKAVIVGKIVGDYFEIIEIASDPETNNMYVKVKLVGFDPAVDGAELLLHLRSGG